MGLTFAKKSSDGSEDVGHVLSDGAALLFSALGQLPPIYEATPDQHVTARITADAITRSLKTATEMIHPHPATLRYLAA